jgi:glyoxylase-like metal-dependent hydrolase (beta-lactamase superfamily II)
MTGEGETPQADASVESMGVGDLKERLDGGEPTTILDVRATSEFDEWHIDDEAAEVENVPYFEFLDGVDEEMLARVPEADPLVVVCAKGGSSEYVAGQLEAAGREAVNLADGMNGWASVYERHEVTRYDGEGRLFQYRRPSSGCLSYLVVGDVAAVVDPLRAFADRYLADAADLDVDLAYAVDTHVHADHVSGVRELAAAGAEAVVPAPAVARGIEYDVEFTTVEDSDTITVGGVPVEAVHTPGHTTGMTSYLVDWSALLSGDGLFTESVARPDLEEGDEGAPDAARQLHETLHGRALALPDDTVVAPGHFGPAAEPVDDGTYSARLGDLRESLDLLSMDRDAFVEHVLADMPPRPANYEEIIAVNLGREDVDDETAFELELGPNNCAATADAAGDD